MKLRLKSAFAMASLINFAPIAHAQTTDVDPCADLPVVNTQGISPFIASMLVPGVTMADAYNAIKPDDRTKMIAMQKSMVEHGKKDWANLCYYRAENAETIASKIRPEVIFLGDSITEFWEVAEPDRFGPKVLDRGISGQTTPQILLRFYQDVVALRPRVVHILAGTNDISGNTGPTANDTIVQNLRAMIDMAKANHIRVVLSAIMPCNITANKRDLQRSARIATVNVALKQLAAAQRITFVDYGAVLANSDGGIQKIYANDGLHPNRDGYAAMKPLVDRVIAQNLK